MECIEVPRIRVGSYCYIGYNFYPDPLRNNFIVFKLSLNMEGLFYKADLTKDDNPNDLKVCFKMEQSSMHLQPKRFL